MRYLVLEAYSAPYFVSNISDTSTPPPPKLFVKGQYLDANPQLNSLQQTVMVSTDGYVVDMGKVATPQIPIAVYPQQYPQQYRQPEVVYKPVEVVAKDTGILSTSNLIKAVVIVILLFVVFKYILPLMKKSVKPA